jgi:leucine dehydrogenase
MFVAVHSTQRGPALGGCRAWSYPDSRAALRDVLRLSRAMTYKAAVADLPLGGGKGVIMVPATGLSAEARRRALLDYGDAVEAVGGRYITAEDVGTSSRDMNVIAQQTRHVAGLPRRRGGSGDPSPFTALGVESAIRASCERVFSSATLRGRSICVVGLGHVGSRVARRCAKAGAKLLVSDVDPAKRHLGDQLGARWITPARSFRALLAESWTTPRCRACAARSSRARPTISWPRTRSPISWLDAGSSGRRTSS